MDTNLLFLGFDMNCRIQDRNPAILKTILLETTLPDS